MNIKNFYDLKPGDFFADENNQNVYLLVRIKKNIFTVFNFVSNSPEDWNKHDHSPIEYKVLDVEIHIREPNDDEV